MKHLKLLTILFCLSMFINKSFANDASDLDVTIRVGGSKQNVHFRTPAANSILNWNSNNIDIGSDIRYSFTPEIFTELEYSYSKVKGGKAADDDIENGAGVYSTHGVEGRANDLKISAGYNIFKKGSFSFSPTIGAFYKEAEITATNGHDNLGNSYEGDGYSQQTNSKYSGVMIGAEIKTVPTKDSKFTFRMDYLLPLDYEADNIWYGRRPPLYWTSKNSEDNLKGDFGFRVKTEYGIKPKKHIKGVEYVKFYAFYEFIKIKGLIEQTGQGATEGGQGRYRMDGRESVIRLDDSLSGAPGYYSYIPSSVGVAKFEAFGAGVAFEF